MVAAGNKTKQPHHGSRSQLLLLVIIGVAVVLAIAQGARMHQCGAGVLFEKNEDSFQPPVSTTTRGRRRLEFVHIPKTGGTAIESEAARHNITWSICHFANPRNVPIISGGETICPETPLTYFWPSHKFGKIHAVPWWHLPPQYIAYEHKWHGSNNPYGDADLFGVVRNAYDRLISEYYYEGTYLHNHSSEEVNNVKTFNEWITYAMKFVHSDSLKADLSRNRTGSRGYYYNAGHYIPQYDFVYEGHTKVMHHVLRFENLTAEFNALMELYELSVRLPEKQVRVSHDKKLGVYNLTEANIKMIEMVYEQDFLEWGYDVMSRLIPGEIFQRNARLVREGGKVVVAKKEDDMDTRMDVSKKSKMSEPKKKAPPKAWTSPIDKLMHEYNLSYPEDWRPKSGTETPKADTFEYAPGRLEFVHIPKTAGTTIESTAARVGISWTICHFSPPQNAFALSHGETLCPGNVPIRDWQPQLHTCPWWHVPPSYFFNNTEQNWPANPYENAKLFCIVRNVYDRVVSEYHYAIKYMARWNDTLRNTPAVMNKWLTTQLTEHAQSKRGDKKYFFLSGHLIPQYDFVYNVKQSGDNDDAPQQVIHHVLKYETLAEDFPALMAEYQLDTIVLPPHKAKKAMGRNYQKQIGVAELNSTVLDLIELIYAKDFEEFGYDKIDRTQRQQSE